MHWSLDLIHSSWDLRLGCKGLFPLVTIIQLSPYSICANFRGYSDGKTKDADRLLLSYTMLTG